MVTHTPQLSVDDVFIALSNVERRKLLDSLITDSPPDDAENTGVEVGSNTAMYHTHLPRLADYGLIHWDKETEQVTKGPNFDAAAEIISFLENESDQLSLEGLQND